MILSMWFRLLTIWLLIAVTASVVPIRAAEAEDLGSECRRRLRLLSDALTLYRAQHEGSFPAKLGDLVREGYLSNRSAIRCPEASAHGLPDKSNPDLLPAGGEDDLRVGYGWEMTPVDPEGWSVADYGMSWHQWKMLQLKSLVGAEVPIVRCDHHGTNVLNLTADGRVYESRTYWESEFVDQLPAPRHAFWMVRQSHLPMSALVRARSEGADDSMLDLRPWYNARFEDPWVFGTVGEELNSFVSDLKDGFWLSQGTKFDPVGIIQLNGRLDSIGGHEAYARPHYPTAVSRIAVAKSFRRLHILGGVLFKSPADTVVARLDFFDESPVAYASWEWRYGQDVERVFVPSDEQAGTPVSTRLTPAWVGLCKTYEGLERRARLFHLVYTNPQPQRIVQHFGFRAGEGVSSPFIAGVTLD